ncbi:MAG: hypothetical protein DI556_10395 [Rhodovulum sulfidophilum]|uniref:Uncharacterized protein n=1 Tax=Rhodovulum sulfidophilum TaxID=35806 RepID=A0A2W5N8R1_RHOSU|nr:MAG: hypothetical protein DI556_10395 [Rhodovulum sulfidophilum]
MTVEASERREARRAEADRIETEIRALREALADFDITPHRREEFDLRLERALARRAQLTGAFEAAADPA